MLLNFVGVPTTTTATRRSRHLATTLVDSKLGNNKNYHHARISNPEDIKVDASFVVLTDTVPVVALKTRGLLWLQAQARATTLRHQPLGTREPIWH